MWEVEGKIERNEYQGSYVTSEEKYSYHKKSQGYIISTVLMSQNRKVKQRTGKKKGKSRDVFRLNLGRNFCL